MEGKVKWFNDKKGFGFIDTKEISDIFVHYATIKSSGHRSLIQGEKVEFTLLKTDKGYQAKNVVSKSIVEEKEKYPVM